MGLKIGDTVKDMVGSIRGLGCVVEIADRDGYVRVSWQGLSFDSMVPALLVTRVCAKCHREATAHTNAGRCLFGASSWS